MLSNIETERQKLGTSDLATQHAQAAKIQAQYRGRSVRQSLDDLKEEAELQYSAASYMAAIYRGRLARRHVEQAKDDPGLTI